MYLKLKILVYLLLSVRSLATPFCDAKTFDSVFNLGHLIYFLRCGEIWTFDPRLDNGYGLMIKDFSPLAVATRNFGPYLQSQLNVFDRKYLNFSGFSFQELSCDNHFEDAHKSCQMSVDSFQHLTILFTPLKAVQFKYKTDFIPLTYGPISDRFETDLSATERLGVFWPKINLIAKDYGFKANNSRIVSALYEPLILKHEEYYCITYLDMENKIFNTKPVDPNVRPDWVDGYCFTGNVVGMFFYRNQVYIAGQVLYDNRVFEDQIYRVYANGEGMVDLEEVFIYSNGEKIPQNLRTLFGCPPEYTAKR